MNKLGDQKKSETIPITTCHIFFCVIQKEFHIAQMYEGQ